MSPGDTAGHIVFYVAGLVTAGHIVFYLAGLVTASHIVLYVAVLVTAKGWKHYLRFFSFNFEQKLDIVTFSLIFMVTHFFRIFRFGWPHPAFSVIFSSIEKGPLGGNGLIVVTADSTSQKNTLVFYSMCFSWLLYV